MQTERRQVAVNPRTKPIKWRALKVGSGVAERRDYA